MPTLQRLLLALVLAGGLAAADPWTPIAGVQVQPDGRMQVDGVTIEVRHYDGSWMPADPKRIAGQGAVQGDGGWLLRGVLTTRSGIPATIIQQVRREGDDALAISIELRDAGPTRMLALVETLDGGRFRGGSLAIGGALVELAAVAGADAIARIPAQRTAGTLLPEGRWLEISASGAGEVLDLAKHRLDAFAVRFPAGESAGVYRLEARLRVRRPAIAAIPLGDAASVPLRDDRAGDRTGGWSDQGDNDLRMLPAGALQAGGVPFATTDRGVVFGGPGRPWLPTSARIDAAGRHGGCLYLLDAIAFAPQGPDPVGVVRLLYADGSQEEHEVRNGRDVGDWWAKVERLPNAALAWTGRNAQNEVGLYLTAIPIADRPLSAIELAGRGSAYWGVVGMAIGERIPLPAQAPDSITPDQRWIATPVPWEVQPGSALDLSELGPAPIPGALRIDGDRFACAGAPGVPVRLLGANLCNDVNLPEGDLAERIPAALRAMGHNAVRLHHVDGLLVKPEGDGTELDPAAMARFDRLAASCAAHGLWITIDLFSSRTRAMPAGCLPGLPEGYRVGQNEFKALIPVLPAAMENWKRFARNLLAHRNTVSGVPWAEDPALLSICLVNEDELTAVADATPVVRAVVDRAFAAWQAAHPGAAGDPAARPRWLLERQAAAYQEMRAFVRDLGVRAAITEVNSNQDWWSLAVRDGFELIDNHRYHDHPKFVRERWKPPFAHHQRSAVADLLGVPTDIAYTRRLDRPFTVTEIQYVLPNRHRAEYPVAVGAVAGLQDWSGLWRFAFAHSMAAVEAGGPPGAFNLAGDPIALLGERAMALLYRRGDVARAPWSAALTYDPATAAAHAGGVPAAAVPALALHARVGCLPGAIAQDAGIPDLRVLLSAANAGVAPAGPLPVVDSDRDLPARLAAAGLVDAADLPADLRRVRSATGEVVCDAGTGILTVATRRSLAAVLPGGTTVDLGGARIANTDAESATVVVAALDAAPLKESRHLLVLHLTDALSSGTVFANRRHTQLETVGDLPTLVRDGAISLALPGAQPARVWGLDLSGARRETAPSAATLALQVRRPWGPCLAWEIAR